MACSTDNPVATLASIALLIFAFIWLPFLYCVLDALNYTHYSNIVNDRSSVG